MPTRTQTGIFDNEASAVDFIEELRTRAGLRRREVPPEEQERRRQAALEALRQLRESNPYLDLADPVAWQREIRQDRRLPFRDSPRQAGEDSTLAQINKASCSKPALC